MRRWLPAALASIALSASIVVGACGGSRSTPTSPTQTTSEFTAGADLSENSDSLVNALVSPEDYDGHWTGSGTGTSTASTPARVNVGFDSANGVLSTFAVAFRVDTEPTTTQSSSCAGTSSFGRIRISDSQFSVSGGNTYLLRVFGTFTSTDTAEGTIEIVPQSAAQPYCLGTTIAWTAIKGEPGPQPSIPPPTPTPTVTVAGQDFDFRRTALGVGQSAQAVATATDSDGSMRDVTSEAVWTTSNESVATVNAGTITGVADGQATIRATFARGSARLDITVTSTPNAPPPTSATTAISGTLAKATDGDTLIQDATVEVISPSTDQGLHSVTDNKGHFTLAGIKSATFTLRYSHPAYRTSDHEYTFRPGTVANLGGIWLRSLSDPKAVTVAGRVYGNSNGSIQFARGVTVEIVRPASEVHPREITDEFGRYKFSDIEATSITIRYSHPSYKVKEEAIDSRNNLLGFYEHNTLLSTDGAPSTTIIGGTVSGTCDGQRCAVSGAEVQVTSPDADAGKRTETDREGRFRLEGIRSSQFVLRFRHPQFEEISVQYSYPVGTVLLDRTVPMGPQKH